MNMRGAKEETCQGSTFRTILLVSTLIMLCGCEAPSSRTVQLGDVSVNVPPFARVTRSQDGSSYIIANTPARQQENPGVIMTLFSEDKLSDASLKRAGLAENPQRVFLILNHMVAALNEGHEILNADFELSDEGTYKATFAKRAVNGEEQQGTVVLLVTDSVVEIIAPSRTSYKPNHFQQAILDSITVRRQ